MLRASNASLLCAMAGLFAGCVALPTDPARVTSQPDGAERFSVADETARHHASLYGEHVRLPDASDAAEAEVQLVDSSSASEATRSAEVSLIATAETASPGAAIEPEVGDVVHETLADGTRVRYVVAHVESGETADAGAARLVSASSPTLLPAPKAPAVGATWEPSTVERVLTPHGNDAEPAAFDGVAGHELDLPTALALVGGRSPSVQIAHERVREAYARWRAAKVLWLPSIGAGASYNKHDGTLQASNGTVTDVDRSSLQAGLGAGAVGAGTNPVPGVVARFHGADAWFQPLIAERAAAARRHAESAELNDQLLAAAVTYLQLLAAEQRRAVAEETVANTRELVRVTTAFAESGQGSQADADRAETELSLRRTEHSRAEEEVAVAAARLAEVLSLDAATRLEPVEPALVPFDLVTPDSELRGLVAEGLGRRPELHAQSALVGEAIRRLQREKSAPLVPSLLLGASYSGFGGGLGGRIDNFQDRVDFDALVSWEFRNLGFGERAARDEARASVRRSKAERVRVMDQVARQIAEAHARVVARRSQIEIAREGVSKAEDSYRRNAERIREGEGLPIEVLQSLRALNDARLDYARSVADHNESQFRLHHALGWPVAAPAE